MGPRKRKAVDGNSEEPKKKRTRSAATAAQPNRSMRITRGMTTDAPRKAVFATAELLENIMLFLPAKTIFGVQRVCKQFRDIVATSAAVQQFLFLRLQSQPQETWMIVSDDDPALGTPEIWSGHSLKRLHESAVPPMNIARRLDGTVATFTSANASPILNLRSYGQGLVARAQLRGQETLTFNLKNASLLQHASWKAMYLIDQPCNKVMLGFQWRIRANGGISGYCYGGVDGMETPCTIGEILDGVLDEERTGEEFYLYWITGSKEGGIKHRGSLRALLSEYTERTGRKAIITADLKIFIQGVMVPTAEERRQVLAGV